MRLLIRHLTSYHYDPPAERCALRLRTFPSVHDAQQVTNWSVTVNGVNIVPLLHLATGDREAIWTSQKPTSQVEVVAEGVIETQDASGVVRGLKNGIRPGVYLRTTPLTEPDDRIRALGEKAIGKALLARMHALNAAVRDAVDYRQGETDARTTASQALKLGRGVCQDHAHVFIAAARSLDVPARYVVGYLNAEGGPLTETHAWAEVYLAELGWVGFDPANRMCPTDRYVRLCSGLDSADAAPIRGNVVASTENLTASVAVTEAQTQVQNQAGVEQGQVQQ